MKYKVGDRVKIVEEFKTRYNVNGIPICPNDTRISYAGKIVTIKKVLNNKYIIEELYKDHFNIYYWTDEMFEGLATETSNTTTEIKLEGNMDFKIKDYKIDKKKQVIVVFFEDGDVQKAKCCDGDTYDFERGLEVCIMKHICGGEKKYYKALKVADEQIVAVDKAKAEAEKRAEIKAKQKAKRAAKRKLRAEKKRAERIAEMREAYLSALKEYNGDIEAAAETVITAGTTETVTKAE